MPKFITNGDTTVRKIDDLQQDYINPHIAINSTDEVRLGKYVNPEQTIYYSITFSFDGNWANWHYSSESRRDRHYKLITRYHWLPQFVLNYLLKK